MTRIVLDTNVLISAVLSPKGKPAEILRLVREDKIELLFSPKMAQELVKVLHYDHITARLNKLDIPLDLVEKFLQGLIKSSVIVSGKLEVDVIKDDPSDNTFLACAIEGQASFIVSGDKHLKKLGQYQKIKIMDPTEFLVSFEYQP